MMLQLNSYEIGLLVNECRGKVIDSFVRNIYEIAPEALAFKVFKPRVGGGELWVVAGYGVFYTEKTVEKESEPPKHVAELRRILVGKKIVELSQLEGERIVFIGFDDSGLYVECMPPGNIVFVKNNVVEWLLKKFMAKDRVVKKGETYKPPPFKPSTSLKKVTTDSIRTLPSKTSVIAALSRDLGLGGKFGEEIVHRAGLEKSAKIRDLTDEQLETLTSSLQQLVKEFENPKPRLYRIDGAAIPSPFELRTRAYAECVETETFGEAVQLAYLETLETQKRKAAEDEKVKAFDAIVKERDNKVYVLGGLEKKLAEVESFIQKLLKASTEVEKAWTSPLETIEKVKALTGLEMELKGDLITLKSADRKLLLRKGSSIYGELGKFYDEAKTIRKAVEKLRQEIRDLDEKIATGEKLVEPHPSTKIVLKKIGGGTKPFREFTTSGGFRVLMGKDARTNEQLLKKNLEKNDVVVHAEVKGSPAAVVKNGVSASAADLEEAAQMTACYSRAWRENFSNISVYWVNAEQVSFSPPSGQYLPKGSFMVYGRKNFIVSELRLAVAELQEGLKIVPYLTAARACKRFVEIRPGDTPAIEAGRKILEILKLDMNSEMVGIVSSMIPYGKCTVVDNLIKG